MGSNEIYSTLHTSCSSSSFIKFFPLDLGASSPSSIASRGAALLLPAIAPENVVNSTMESWIRPGSQKSLLRILVEPFSSLYLASMGLYQVLSVARTMVWYSMAGHRPTVPCRAIGPGPMDGWQCSSKLPLIFHKP
jgi:hypothetical protein